jgi:hypothetical protein
MIQENSPTADINKSFTIEFNENNGKFFKILFLNFNLKFIYKII